jgi:hypothetical protein
MNILSFPADYDNPSKKVYPHHEVAILSRDKKMLAELKEMYFNW